MLFEINRMTDILLEQARTPDVTWTRAFTRPTGAHPTRRARGVRSNYEQLRYQLAEPAISRKQKSYRWT